MKKEHVIGILFFGGLWGISEAVLGDALYSAQIAFASIPLTIIAMVILAIAHTYLPQIGTATLIAACAMLYKFLNTPMFACHFLGIVLTGICFDVFLVLFKFRSRALAAATAAFVSSVSFIVLIAYVFRYGNWPTGGFAKVITNVGFGAIAALGCAVFVPLAFHLAQRLRNRVSDPFALKVRLAPISVSLTATGLWVFAIAALLAQVQAA